MYGDDDKGLAALVGKTVRKIWMSEDYLTFKTEDGLITYSVSGDCCSTSYFFDFYGVRNLLSNGPVLSFESVQLSPGDVGYVETPESDGYGEYTQVYGYRITTDHPLFGPVSSVFSFRNESNGYYGGWMSLKSEGKVYPDQERLTDDKIG